MDISQKLVIIVYLSELVKAQSFGWPNFDSAISSPGINIPSFSYYTRPRTNLGYNNYVTQPYYDYHTPKTTTDNRKSLNKDDDHRVYDWNYQRNVTTPKTVYNNDFGNRYKNNNERTTIRSVINNNRNVNINNQRRTSTTERVAYHNEFKTNENNNQKSSTERVNNNNRNNNNNNNDYNQRSTTKQPPTSYETNNNNNQYYNNNNNNQRHTTSTERSNSNTGRNRGDSDITFNSNKNKGLNNQGRTTERNVYDNNNYNDQEYNNNNKAVFNNQGERTTRRSLYRIVHNDDLEEYYKFFERTTTKKASTIVDLEDEKHRYDKNRFEPVSKETKKKKNENKNFYDTNYYDENDSISFDEISDEKTNNGKKNNDIPFTSFINTPDDQFYVTEKPFYSNDKNNFATTRKPVRTSSKPTSAPITNRPDSNIRYPDESSTPELIIGPDETRLTERQKNSYINMVEKLCDNYKALNTKQVQAIPLLPSPDPVRVNVTNCRAPTPLIVGGKGVTIGQFPHQAAVGWSFVTGQGYAWKCGGSLISDHYVLTAAHCAFQERDQSVISGPPTAVQLGSTYLDGSEAKIYLVKTAIRHPRYLLPKSYYDLALLRLKERVRFTDTIRPACLGTPPRTGENIIATGWGQTSQSNKGQTSRELRGVSLPVWDISTCSRSLGLTRNLPQGPMGDSQMCAGEPRGGKDTCQGDSGGPAQIKDGCTWRIVAVTSIGRSCAAVNTPAVYAVVQKVFIGRVIAEEL